MNSGEKKDLIWQLQTSGTLEQLGHFCQLEGRHQSLRQNLPPEYDLTDVSPFNPSAAIYFMNGYSAATVRLLSSGEEISFEWFDENTSIAASPPELYSEEKVSQGLYVPVPPPLVPVAHFPRHAPDRYTRKTTLHLLQVVSMNMRSRDDSSSLLIGLPYAQKYPKIFGASGLLQDAVNGAASYGIVQSLTEFDDPTGQRTVSSNGYPARSFFAIYHLLETKLGAFFNKKATQMELQPSANGKLALTLPPIPFHYTLQNGPIPLFDIKKPDGEPVAEITKAAHGADRASTKPTKGDWPFLKR